MAEFFESVPHEIWIFILVGFFAQMIDGTLGMAYGVSCNSFLLSFGGLSAAAASAAVHLAEVFTTLVSGISHWRMKNIDKRLFLSLVIPGVLGGVLGAFVLSEFDGERIKPFVCAYLVIMGGVIIFKAFKEPKKLDIKGAVYPLGFVGGLSDAVGGGGWGPVVTSTLIAVGQDPKKTIGSVNTAEFFVTFAQTLTFAAFIGYSHSIWPVAGLILGGVVASPIAAYLCKRIPVKPLMIIVGVIIVFLNLRVLILEFF